MKSNLFVLVLTLLLSLSLQSEIYNVNRIVNISLNKSIPNKLAYAEYLNLIAHETWLLSVVDFPDYINYGVLQVHSYGYNVSLSKTLNMGPDSSVNGTNIGLNIYKNDEFYLVNIGPFVNISVMVAVTVYDDTVPVIGGCNMEFPTEDAPYLRENYLYSRDNKGLHKMEAAPALVSNKICGMAKIKYDWYHYYFPSRDHSEKTYFESLNNFLTVDKIMENGIMSQPRPGLAVMLLYNVFFGDGVIYVVIASIDFKNTTYRAAYVPYVTYSCSLVFSDNNCDLLGTTFEIVLCIISFLVGISFTFFGCWLSAIFYFICHLIFTGLITYIAMSSLHFTADTSLWVALVVASSITAFCCTRRCLWFLSMFVPGFLLGILLVGTIQVFVPDGSSFIQYDSVYYAVSISLIVVLGLLMQFMFPFHYLGSVIIGTVLINVPIDYYWGGRFSYSLINIFRRAAITDFKYAVISSSFQWIDTVTLVVKLITAILGMIAQAYQLKKSQSHQPRGMHSSAPLLGGNVLHTSYGSDEVFF